MSAAEYYDHSTYPSQGASGSSSAMRAELDLIETGFGKLPGLSGNGSKIVSVNSGGTALEAVTTTGTGNAVRATSPTLVTPTLGVATATSLNGITFTASTGTFTLTNGKTLTWTNTGTVSGNDGFALNVGAGGTLGTAAYTAASAYAPAAGSSSIVTVGTVTSGTWNGGVIGAAYGGSGVSNNAANTVTYSGNYAMTFTLTGTTALTLPVTGTLISTDSAASQAQMEAASSNAVMATPGNMNWHPGMAKAWVKANASGTNLASHNITSVTDDGIGQITVTIATDFSSAHYVINASIETGSTAMFIVLGSQAAGSFTGYCRVLSGSPFDAIPASDPTNWLFACFGDQ